MNEYMYKYKYITYKYYVTAEKQKCRYAKYLTKIKSKDKNLKI